MKNLAIFFVLFVQTLLGADYDCVFVGTSPIPLFEAIYQSYLGKSVLILEQANECGGAWKSIDVCGIEHVDLGCHTIGNDLQLKEFLEVYGGCKIVSMDSPKSSEFKLSTNGFYFSKGCYELIHNLNRWIDQTGITLLKNHRLESIYVDTNAEHVVVKTGGKEVTAKKVFYTQMTSFFIENLSQKGTSHKTKYPHLYLLIQDPTPPKFSYVGYGGFGASRAMNLTHFVDLEGTGRQLIVFQMNVENSLQNGELLIEDMKNRNLIDKAAYLLSSESYIYESAYALFGKLQSQFSPYFEMLNAGTISNMSKYTQKWKQALPPYREAIPSP